MSKRTGDYSGRHFFLTVALPTIGAAIALVIAAFLLLQWSVKTFDAASVARQKDLVGAVVGHLRADIAHQQEASTVWDEAVLAMRNLATPNWIDANLGSWMHTHYGHDASFVVDSTDVPVFASEGEHIVPLDEFAHFAAAAAPLFAEVREKMRTGDLSGQNARTVSPGASDFAIAEGRPAIVSVKPIVSDSGTIEQTPGTEYLHVSVRYLDDDFLTELEQLYLFDGLHFARTWTADDDAESYPLRAANGTVIGYLAWTPYRPGSEVFRSLTPMIGGLLSTLLAAVSAVLLIWHGRNSAERVQEERIHHLVHHDALTDLPNRTTFHTHLDAVLVDPTSGGGALLYLDIDHLKVLNATRGHAAGDAVVREAGRRLAEATGERGLACRLDGDEFGVIALGLDAVAATQLCDDILAAFRPAFEIDDTVVFIGASIGISLFPQHGIESSELFRKADVALHQAKQDGRGRAATFNAELGAVLMERTELEQDLRWALRDFSEISVYYQPVFRASDRELVAAEALARWNHPRRGWVSPAQFIPIAESSNLIKRLGAYVLRVACHAAAEWNLGTIAVNVSTIQLRDPTFAAAVRAVLDDTCLPPEHLELEITESTWVDDSNQCTTNLRELRALGVRIALDDFGTGFSTFGRLQESQIVDRIKIDQSFVRGSGETKGDKAIVRAIVDLARAKGIRTTAEGVETAESAEFLTSIGCDELQGFLLARPMPHDQATALICGRTDAKPMRAG